MPENNTVILTLAQKRDVANTNYLNKIREIDFKRELELFQTSYLQNAIEDREVDLGRESEKKVESFFESNDLVDLKEKCRNLGVNKMILKSYDNDNIIPEIEETINSLKRTGYNLSNGYIKAYSELKRLKGRGLIRRLINPENKKIESQETKIKQYENKKKLLNIELLRLLNTKDNYVNTIAQIKKDEENLTSFLKEKKENSFIDAYYNTLKKGVNEASISTDKEELNVFVKYQHDLILKAYRDKEALNDGLDNKKDEKAFNRISASILKKKFEELEIRETSMASQSSVIEHMTSWSSKKYRAELKKRKPYNVLTWMKSLFFKKDKNLKNIEQNMDKYFVSKIVKNKLMTDYLDFRKQKNDLLNYIKFLDKKMSNIENKILKLKEKKGLISRLFSNSKNKIKKLESKKREFNLLRCLAIKNHHKISEVISVKLFKCLVDQEKQYRGFESELNDKINYRKKWTVRDDSLKNVIKKINPNNNYDFNLLESMIFTDGESKGMERYTQSAIKPAVGRKRVASEERTRTSSRTLSISSYL